MALRAGLLEIRLQHLGAAVAGLRDVVRAVAVDAERRDDLRLLARGRQLRAHAVKVGEVRRENVRREAVLRHHRLVRVALRAEVDRREAPVLRARVGDVVRMVAVGADGHVRIARRQRHAVDALRVRLGDVAVAGPARLGDSRARHGRAHDVVRAVAVHAERRASPLREDLVVHAVERLRVVLEVAGLAEILEGRAEGRLVLRRQRRGAAPRSAPGWQPVQPCRAPWTDFSKTSRDT